MRKCVVCGERASHHEASGFCVDCINSRRVSRDGEITWAAKRARYYERRRARKEIETLTDEVAVASDEASSRMHTCPRCGFSTQPKKERSR